MKIQCACRFLAPVRCIVPSFQRNTFEGTMAFRNEGTMRGCPLKKVLLYREIGIWRTHKKKEKKMGYQRMDLLGKTVR